MRSRTTFVDGYAKPLDRYEIDRIARAVARGRRGNGARLDAVADAVAAGLTAKLAAAGVRSPGSRSRRPWSALDRGVRAVIVARVDKHLAEAPHGSSRAR
jgi:hypothetical protein